MDSFGECSYSENHYNDEFEDSICEEKVSTEGPSFETLTAADIITLMNEYIEKVETIVEVSLIASLFLDFYSK